MEQTSLRNRREAEAWRPQRIPSPHPRVLDPAPVNTGMNRLKPQPGLALLPPPPKSSPWGSHFPPSDLYTLTSTSPTRDNNTLSTWKSRPEEKKGGSEKGLGLGRERDGGRGSQSGGGGSEKPRKGPQEERDALDNQTWAGGSELKTGPQR